MISMLYLSDRPNNTSRENCEFVTDNPQAIKIIDYLRQHSQTLIQLNNYLIRNFQKYRPDYQPIKAHDYVPPIPKLDDAAKNTLIGFNETLNQALVYQHQPIYLVIK